MKLQEIDPRWLRAQIQIDPMAARAENAQIPPGLLAAGDVVSPDRRSRRTLEAESSGDRSTAGWIRLDRFKRKRHRLGRINARYGVASQLAIDHHALRVDVVLRRARVRPRNDRSASVIWSDHRRCLVTHRNADGAAIRRPGWIDFA